VALVEGKCRVGVNMGPAILASILEGAAYLNVQTVAALEARDRAITYEEALRGRLGRYYDDRVAFDEAFERGSEFKYGAANVGGVGSLHYGSACAILKHEGVERIALLPGDSLRLYVSDTGVDLASITYDVGAWDARCKVAAIKLHSEVCRRSPDTWSRLVCCDDDYIEAIFVDDVGGPELREVRFVESQDRQFRDAVYATQTGAADADTRAHAHTYTRVRRGLRALNIPLVVVPDA
jgi:hypothetical protein